MTEVAWPAWRRIASLRVRLSPSCINRSRVRMPHSGGVRTLLRVPGPPFWTMPSPVPTSCSRKSLNGRIRLSPRAGGTTKAPPLITVPGGAVTISETWQWPQPIWKKSWRPATAAGVDAAAASRGGALVARMKRANASMSGPAGSSGVGASSGSGTSSKSSTELPFEVFSSGANGLVMPISLR